MAVLVLSIILAFIIGCLVGVFIVGKALFNPFVAREKEFLQFLDFIKMSNDLIKNEDVDKKLKARLEYVSGEKN